jgi:SecD/SecF fusion protein
MQNKGAIRLFAISFAVVCLYELSFNIWTTNVESKAKSFADTEATHKVAKDLAKGDMAKENVILDSLVKVKEKYYLDSVSTKTVLNLGFKKFTYKDVKEREINLGLDLKGGMNVTMEISVADIIRGMAGNTKNPVFNKALDMAIEREKKEAKDIVTLFGQSFAQVDPNARLAPIFNRVEYSDRIHPTSTNKEVLKVIRDEANNAISRTFNILRARIDRFGVVQPNIQKLESSDRILIELPGIKEPERVRKLLQGSAKLEFWETYKMKDVYPYLMEASNRLAGMETISDTLKKSDSIKKADSAKVAPVGKTIAKANQTKKAVPAKVDASKSKNALLEKLGEAKKAVEGKGNTSDKIRKNNLFAYLMPSIDRQTGKPIGNSTVGYASIKDTATINKMLKLVKESFPKNMLLAWTVKPEKNNPDVLELVALRVTSRDGSAPLGGDVIVNARQDYNQNGQVEISMKMNSEGARIWKRLTGANVGNQIAIVLDGFVYSAPNVNDEIPNGSSSISGSYTVEEAQDLANILQAGKLPAPARIVSEDVVGPTLGKEAIQAGTLSFIIAFVMVLLYMQLYYGKAGLIANVALLTNLFFLFGVLASLKAVLTLPGIAGIVITMGIAVDANVLIYERIREELRKGQGMRLAVKDGFRHALSAIIDGHVTSILTGIVLYVFGTGPIQGFATTFVIGLLTSLFTAIFIPRLMMERMMDRNKTITYGNKFTNNLFTKVNIDFLGIRKILYCVSGTLIVISLISFATKGLNLGIDFTGGRSYVVRFDQDVKTNDIRQALTKQFGEGSEVKTLGSSSQVKITTKYKIDENNPKIDNEIAYKLYESLKSNYVNKQISFEEFASKNGKIGIMNSQKVGPTIAADIKNKAIMAVFFALLIIFTYIALRFRKWQYGLGGVISLFHDTCIVIGAYSLLDGVLPFPLEADQSFIAAILTIIGYSITDSVIIFDRIREYNKLYPKRDLKINMDEGMNHTIGRTVNTSGTVLVTLLAIFIFGGNIIRGFTFALLLGVIIGTYSSIFNATPIAYDLITWQKRREAKKAALLKK